MNSNLDDTTCRVRSGRLTDLPVLLPLVRALHAESPILHDTELSVDRVESVLASACTGEGSVSLCLYLAVVGEAVVGFMLGTATRHWLSEDLVAYEVALYATPDHRKGPALLHLVRAFDEWAQHQGATLVSAGSGDGICPDDARRAYAFAGLHSLGPCMGRPLRKVPVGEYDAFTALLSGGMRRSRP